MRKILGAMIVTMAACGGGGTTSNPDARVVNNPDASATPDAMPSGGSIAATWILKDWNDTTGTETVGACPSGADTVITYALAAGQTDPANAIKDLFTCGDGHGTATGIPSGTYTEWVEVTDHSGNVLYAQSLSKQVVVVAGQTTPVSFTFQVNRGYVAATWSLVNNSSVAVTCASRPSIAGVEFNETGTGAALVHDVFTCADMAGTTYPLPLDTYTLSVQAIDNANPANGIGAAANVPGLMVTFGNQLVDAGAVILHVDAVN
jgi:hypothetical protein